MTRTIALSIIPCVGDNGKFLLVGEKINEEGK